MPYVTRQQYIQRFSERELIQLTDRDADGAEDQGVFDSCCADADAEVNSYLAVRYQLPLVTTPELLKRVSADVVRYRLYKDHASEEVRKRYEDAVRLLKLLADGSATLGVPVAPAPATDAGSILVDSAGRVFTRDSLADF